MESITISPRPRFPARQDRLVLVLVLEWDRADHGRYLFKADLEDESGRPSLTVEGETEVHRPPPEHPPARSQLIMPLEDVVFPGRASTSFRVKVKGQTLEGPSIYLMEAPEGPAGRERVGSCPPATRPSEGRPRHGLRLAGSGLVAALRCSRRGTLYDWASHRARDIHAGRGPVHVVDAPVPGPAGAARWVVRHYRRGGAAAPLLGDRYWGGQCAPGA
jgi:hypothetical protein